MLKKSFLTHTNQEEATKLWNQLVQSTTEHEYDGFAHGLESFLFDKDSAFFDYLASTWLKYKEKFVSYWTNQYLHFGNSATS